MKYVFISVQPKDAEKKINQLAEQGFKVISQSESTCVISKCFGLSKEVDVVVNIILGKE